MLSDDLLELQRIDTASDQLAHRRANLPERAASDAATADVARTRERIAMLLQRQRELTEAIEQAERTGAELTATRERLQAQLRTVTSPREADALTHELDTIAARRDELDDAELGHLDEQQHVVGDLAALHTAESDLASAAETATATLAAAEEEIDRQLGELTVERAAAVARIDGGVLADYEHRRARLGGVAVARLEGNRCGGCHLDLSTKELGEIRATSDGEIAECPQCGRMLVP